MTWVNLLAIAISLVAIAISHYTLWLDRKTTRLRQARLQRERLRRRPSAQPHRLGPPEVDETLVKESPRVR